MTRFTVGRSLCLLIVFLASHATAAFLLAPLQLNTHAKAALWLLIAASLAHSVLRHALLRTPRAIVHGTVIDSLHASVICRDGSKFEAHILGTTYVSPLLSVLNVRAVGSRSTRHVILLPDNIEAEDYRRVRVALKWARSPAL